MDRLEAEFTRMIRTHRKTIHTVCSFFTEDPDELDDLKQEVMINLWKGFGQFKGESSEKTWIWRVSLNTCMSQDRKKKRQVDTIPLKEEIDPRIQKEESKQIEMLYKRIGKLNLFDRAIILLWLENMSYDDIAEIAGISPSAVTMRLHRIRLQLKEMSDN